MQNTENIELGTALRMGGILGIVFSIVAGTLVLFVVATANSYANGIQMFFVALSLIGGTTAFVTGRILESRKRRAASHSSKTPTE